MPRRGANTRKARDGQAAWQGARYRGARQGHGLSSSLRQPVRPARSLLGAGDPGPQAREILIIKVFGIQRSTPRQDPQPEPLSSGIESSLPSAVSPGSVGGMFPRGSFNRLPEQ